jgi:hypothetical protein
MTDTERALDGNVLGGLLGEVFAQEMTGARGTCDACGAVGDVGEAVVYLEAPGAVARCRSCGEVLLVIVRRADRYVLGFERVRSLELVIR